MVTKNKQLVKTTNWSLYQLVTKTNNWLLKQLVTKTNNIVIKAKADVKREDKFKVCGTCVQTIRHTYSR